jgi:hypothetical protein
VPRLIQGRAKNLEEVDSLGRIDQHRRVRCTWSNVSGLFMSYPRRITCVKSGSFTNPMWVTGIPASA